MKLYNWNLLDDEPLNPNITRKAIHGASFTVARLHLLESAVVPEHSHAHEQLSMVERGALKFQIGGREQIVRAGEALLIAPHEAHAVEVLEETFVTDVFSPAREDWIRGDDAYLRR
jgi:quercetin dioxygenase-like cupin family protein